VGKVACLRPGEVRSAFGADEGTNVDIELKGGERSEDMSGDVTAVRVSIIRNSNTLHILLYAW
jgi:hypothetical protein